jgi:hypothetical protein
MSWFISSGAQGFGSCAIFSPCAEGVAHALVLGVEKPDLPWTRASAEARRPRTRVHGVRVRPDQDELVVEKQVDGARHLGVDLVVGELGKAGESRVRFSSLIQATRWVAWMPVW